jgi:hypothetical protein
MKACLKAQIRSNSHNLKQILLHRHSHNFKQVTLVGRTDQKKSITAPTKKMGDKTKNYHGISLLSTSYKILWNIHLKRLTPYIKLLGIINFGFDVTDKLLIRFLTFIRYWRKKTGV